MNGADENILIRRYLLGQLLEEERQLADQRMLIDDTFYERVLLVEDDLTDEYAAGLLSSADRESVERFFIPVPRRNTQLRLAKLLTVHATKQRDTRLEVSSGRPRLRAPVLGSFADRRIWPVAVAAALLVLLAGSVLWLLFEARRLTADVREAQSRRADQDQQSRQLEEEIARLRAGVSELTSQVERERSLRYEMEKHLSRLTASEPDRTDIEKIASFLLTPGLLREGGQVVDIPLTAGVTRVRLLLRLEGEQYRVYRATIQSDEGARVLQSKNMRPPQSKRGSDIVMTVRASALLSGDYVVRLEGSNDDRAYTRVGTYYLRVVKKTAS